MIDISSASCNVIDFKRKKKRWYKVKLDSSRLKMGIRWGVSSVKTSWNGNIYNYTVPFSQCMFYLPLALLKSEGVGVVTKGVTMLQSSSGNALSVVWGWVFVFGTRKLSTACTLAGVAENVADRTDLRIAERGHVGVTFSFNIRQLHLKPNRKTEAFSINTNSI